jgi:hypothetical protein
MDRQRNITPVRLDPESRLRRAQADARTCRGLKSPELERTGLGDALMTARKPKRFKPEQRIRFPENNRQDSRQKSRYGTRRNMPAQTWFASQEPVGRNASWTISGTGHFMSGGTSRDRSGIEKGRMTERREDEKYRNYCR